MKTFYSILYCPIRQIVDEQISIGLLLMQGENVFFSYSPEKLKVISGLISKDAYHLLKSNLKSIDALVNNRNVNSVLGNFEEKIFTEQYITYLSRYSNNLIKFSTPKVIEIDATTETFGILFRKYVFEVYQEKFTSIPVNLIERVKNHLNPKIESKVNIDIELKSSEIPNLIIPTKVWFIGHNEVPVTGELVDFGAKAITNLENKLRSYLFLVQNVSEMTKISGTYFLVGNEPPISTKNHQIWSSIVNANELNYVPVNEAEDRIQDYIKTHGVTPFIPPALKE